ncbi:MAG: tripartite tricarboxylate transporter permease [Alphaproteobacteria bacterium]|nr:tripartite tricarboxylate transporter permease [Alphaproteobacteria bacterium]
MESFLPVLESAFAPGNLAWILFGVPLGYLGGGVPGLGKGTATAVAIPLTFYLSPLAAIAFLVGIAKGSTAGSAVSAILLNTPGEPSSTPTAMAGYPLARAGKAQKALKMGLFASVIGDLFSTIVLILVAQELAEYALGIGPVELTGILAFSMVFIAGLSGRSMIKGLIAGLFGILVSCVGLEVETGSPRLTFGMIEVYDGLPLIPVAIGMLALSEMMIQIGQRRRLQEEADLLRGSGMREDRIVTLGDWRRSARAILRGCLIGTGVGILPGLGASVGSFLSYGAERKASGRGADFEETGAIEGVAAAESADNAVVPASFVPLFAIGIPGSVIAAILIGAFTIQGITPGPLLFLENRDLILGVYMSMIAASLFLLLIGYFGQNVFARIVRISPALVMPIVVFLCCLGAYLQGGGAFGIGVMVVFGVIGFFAKKYDFSFVTFLIGFVIGPSFELSLRQTLGLVTDISELLDHPVALAFGALAVFGVWRLTVLQRRQREAIVGD